MKPSKAPPSPTSRLSVETLIREKSVVKGVLSPLSFPELGEFLAEAGGEIQYQISAHAMVDSAGSRSRHLKCIISGWFPVLDSQTLESKRFLLDVVSKLRLVESEAELPSLEEEAADEDVIVCGKEFDLVAGLQEEILLALPHDTPRVNADAKSARGAGERQAGAGSNVSARTNPFEKLAALKSVAPPSSPSGEKSDDK